MLPDAKHPIWSLLRLVVVNASVLIAVLSITSKFDSELYVVLAALGASGASEMFARQAIK